MARYHIGKDGNPHICRADAGKCPLGGEHYDSMAKATAAAEEAAVPREDTSSASLGALMPSGREMRYEGSAYAVDDKVGQSVEDAVKDAASAAGTSAATDVDGHSDTAGYEFSSSYEMRGNDLYAVVDVTNNAYGDSSGIVDSDEYYEDLDPSHRPTDEEAEAMADQDNQDDIDNDPSLADPPFDSDDLRGRIADNLHDALLETGADVPVEDLEDRVHATVNYKPVGLHSPEDYQEYWDDHYDYGDDYGDDDKDGDGDSKGDSKGDSNGDAPSGGRRDPSGFIDYSHPDTYSGTKDFLGAFGWDGNDV